VKSYYNPDAPRPRTQFVRGRGPYSRVLYHGTQSSFDEFAPQGEGWVRWTFGEPVKVPRGGFFFTDNPKFARGFAGAKGRVIKAKVNLGELPYPLTYVNWGETKEMYPDFAANPKLNYDLSNKLDDIMREQGAWSYQPWMLFDEEAGPKTIAALEEAGFASAAFRETDENDESGWTFVVWNPKNIKVIDPDWHP
jgi:ADP-Ribosyltransferase in polyvalent proteins